MKKATFLAISLAAAISLNAATLATVNGKNITDSDIADIIGGEENLKKLSPDVKHNILEGLINTELLYTKAKKDGIEKDSKYKKALDRYSKEIAITTWIGNISEGIKVTDDEIKNFYNKNKDKMVEPAQFKAKHILVRTEASAKSIIKQLGNLKGKELDNKFAKLASELSVDPSATNGGELGWMVETTVVPEFAKAALALKKGEFTKTPVKTQFGYHIILKEDQKDKTQLSLNDVKSELSKVIRQQMSKEKLDEILRDLKKTNKIEYK